MSRRIGRIFAHQSLSVGTLSFGSNLAARLMSARVCTTKVPHSRLMPAAAWSKTHTDTPSDTFPCGRKGQIWHCLSPYLCCCRKSRPKDGQGHSASAHRCPPAVAGEWRLDRLVFFQDKAQALRDIQHVFERQLHVWLVGKLVGLGPVVQQRPQIDPEPSRLRGSRGGHVAKVAAKGGKPCGLQVWPRPTAGGTAIACQHPAF